MEIIGFDDTLPNDIRQLVQMKGQIDERIKKLESENVSLQEVQAIAAFPWTLSLRDPLSCAPDSMPSLNVYGPNSVIMPECKCKHHRPIQILANLKSLVQEEGPLLLGLRPDEADVLMVFLRKYVVHEIPVLEAPIEGILGRLSVAMTAFDANTLRPY